MTEYKTLRTIFHISEEKAKTIYDQRFNSKDAIHFDFSVVGSQAFYVMDSEVYKLILAAERLDREITNLQKELPEIAIDQYKNKCLIDEIVLTNEIEGVHSSRQEIDDVLENLAKQDKRGRFQGIVEKYNALNKGGAIPLKTCQDIRNLYDELVLDEVVRENPKNRPDGEFFRKGITHVLDESGRPIHDGVEPESKIIELVEKALSILNDETVETIVRVSLFHFIFSYIHPFYDGNGRTNRFISSAVLASSFSPLPGLRLSFAIKEHIQKYYKAFSICEHTLNRGDLTPFVIMFAQIIVDAMESMRESLREKKQHLDQAMDQILICFRETHLDRIEEDIAYILTQAALFSERGLSAKDLAAIKDVSVPTIYGKIKKLDEKGLIRRSKKGRVVYMATDLNRLSKLT